MAVEFLKPRLSMAHRMRHPLPMPHIEGTDSAGQGSRDRYAGHTYSGILRDAESADGA